MSGFGRALPGIRRRTAAHLKKEGLPREKVLAAVVRLLERSLIRVGNYEYARSNGSFGLTTLRDRHVDFRTWAGTIEMAAALMECGPCEDESEANRRVAEGVKRVAERLGNTPAVCRECYIHPEVVDRYLDGTLAERLDPGGKPVRFEKVRGLTVEESAVLALIEVWSPEPTATG